MARLLLYLFNLVFVTIIGWILARIVQRLFGSPTLHSGASSRVRPGENSAPAVRGETARDPVCGMFVSTEISHRFTRGSQTLHFCSRECLERYQKEANHS